MTDALYPFRAPATSQLGSCIGGVAAIDYSMSKVYGRTALAHRILRRLNTPRGGVFYAENYGYDLSELIGSTVSASVVEQRVAEQVLSEEEIEDARVTAAFSNGTLAVSIEAVDGEGPFALVLGADQLTVSALLDGVELFKETT